MVFQILRSPWGRQIKSHLVINHIVLKYSLPRKYNLCTLCAFWDIFKVLTSLHIDGSITLRSSVARDIS